MTWFMDPPTILELGTPAKPPIFDLFYLSYQPIFKVLKKIPNPCVTNGHTTKEI